MTLHSADENWTMGTFNPKTHKVVPIESVVIDGFSKGDIYRASLYAASWAREKMDPHFQNLFCDISDQMLPLTPPTPPLSEPTEFGTMVEADYHNTFGRTNSLGQLISRARWVKTPTHWISEFGNMRYWSDLTNPTLFERDSR